MTWFSYLVCALWASGTFLIIRDVGKPRGPISPSTAAWVATVNLFLILGIVLGW
jgi:hypothetical protein